MSVDPASLLDAALALYGTQRASLANQLLRSLKPFAVMGEDDPALETELDRRVDAYESGESATDDWHNVSQRLRKEFGVGESRSGEVCTLRRELQQGMKPWHAGS